VGPVRRVAGHDAGRCLSRRADTLSAAGQRTVPRRPPGRRHGIHAKGWTREQAQAYFRSTSRASRWPRSTATSPARAGLAYKIGELGSGALRTAPSMRWDAFRSARFHDVILRNGRPASRHARREVTAYIAQARPVGGGGPPIRGDTKRRSTCLRKSLESTTFSRYPSASAVKQGDLERQD
jgi:hypothetical protein